MIAQEVANEGRVRRRYKRVVGPYLLSVFFLVTLNFFLPRTLPGDPISAMLVSGGSTSSSAYVQDEPTRVALSRYYGLDKPLVVQYGSYLGDLAQGDLGCRSATGRRCRA